MRTFDISIYASLLDRIERFWARKSEPFAVVCLFRFRLVKRPDRTFNWTTAAPKNTKATTTAAEKPAPGLQLLSAPTTATTTKLSKKKSQKVTWSL